MWQTKTLKSSIDVEVESVVDGAFGCDGKYYFPEMNFLLTVVWSLDHGNANLPSFSLQMNSVACKTQREGEKKQNTTRELEPQNKTAIERARTSPTTAINASRDRAVDRDLRGVGLELARSAPPGARSPPAIIGLTGMFFSSLARALSLSLSLFPEMLWSENEGRNHFPWSRLKISVNRKLISGK